VEGARRAVAGPARLPPVQRRAEEAARPAPAGRQPTQATS